MFIFYTNDLPVTCDRKFIYADDICLATQGRYSGNWSAGCRQIWHKCFDYCRQWRLKPGPAKTVSSVFHLHNTCASRDLSVSLDGHDRYPTYLGVTLDCTLSFREHPTKTAGKLKNRNNLLMKLAGVPTLETLRTSAMALCYSVAEYCAPVWSWSSHTGPVDVQLNSCLWHFTFHSSSMVTSPRQH